MFLYILLDQEDDLLLVQEEELHLVQEEDFLLVQEEALLLKEEDPRLAQDCARFKTSASKARDACRKVQPGATGCRLSEGGTLKK